eukprot:283026-Chlamydomonas_euryale.AAC.6
MAARMAPAHPPTAASYAATGTAAGRAAHLSASRTPPASVSAASAVPATRARAAVMHPLRRCPHSIVAHTLSAPPPHPHSPNMPCVACRER